MPDSEEENPFERWGIDPTKGPAAITERMRALALEAPDEEARRAIREAWEELTLHPARRFRAALRAHPESYGGEGPWPPPPRPPRASPPDLELLDLLLRPSVVEALGLRDAARLDPLPDDPLSEDPILGLRRAPPQKKGHR